MKLLDWTLPAPEENLAADEALLDWCEARDDTEVLRFWEAAQHFVVVGYANNVATEVNVAACAARGVPILRRCSGGGTVLQGPGCLNYTAVLRINPLGPTRGISATNRFVMERNCAALKSEIRNPKRQFQDLVAADVSPLHSPRNQSGLTAAATVWKEPPESEISVCGLTDLALAGVKFSGNAQRRKRRCLLFHGTILLGLDLALVEELLPLPSREPDYRQNRPHLDFIRNLPLSADVVKQALRRVWRADEPFDPPPTVEVEALVQEKYGRREWTFR